MIVAKKSYSNYAYDNYAYDDYSYDFERQDSYSETKKSIKKQLDVKHKVKIKAQLKMITMVILMFGIGTLIVSRYAMIMNLSNQSKDIKSSIAMNQKENEQLKLELMKYYDIKQIEHDATAELNMVRPTSQNTVYISVQAKDIEGKIDGSSSQYRKAGILDKFASLFE